jgi:magnesium-transporting ATPase (P-type)
MYDSSCRKMSISSSSIIIMYILLALIVSTAVIYFVVASQEYSDLVDFLQVGIQGETQEKQVEMALFIGAGIVYLGLFVWILKTKIRSKIPYIVVAAVSVILIATYAASRTIGVPIVGVEYYIGKLDMVSKVLQVIMIGISVYLISAARKTMIKEETIR